MTLNKNILLLTILVVSVNSSRGQQTFGGKDNDKMLIQGYLVRLLPKNNNGFGYDIFYKDRMVVHQTSNPFTLSPIGMNSKEDVLKIAKWQIKQHQANRNHFLVKNQFLSKDIAKKLDISIN
jgi:hypothetical protein